MDKSIPSNAIVTISKEELAKLPAAEFQGEIRLVEEAGEVEKAINELRASSVIGFDTETRPSFKKGQINSVALVQLSNLSTCYLFRINLIGLHQAIIDLLEDPQVIKIGLSIHDDFHNLSKISEINPEGFVDLQTFVKNVGIADNSLSKIYGVLFGQRISKGQRLTNWEAKQLTPHQQAYAALDAMACVEIFNHINNGNFNPSESPYLTIQNEETLQTKNDE